MGERRLLRIVGHHIGEFELAGRINLSNRISFDDMVSKRVNINPRKRMSIMVTVNSMVRSGIEIRRVIRSIANAMLIGMNITILPTCTRAGDGVRLFSMVSHERGCIREVIHPCTADRCIGAARPGKVIVQPYLLVIHITIAMDFRNGIIQVGTGRRGQREGFPIPYGMTIV